MTSLQSTIDPYKCFRMIYPWSHILLSDNVLVSRINYHTCVLLIIVFQHLEITLTYTNLDIIRLKIYVFIFKLRTPFFLCNHNFVPSKQMGSMMHLPQHVTRTINVLVYLITQSTISQPADIF